MASVEGDLNVMAEAHRPSVASIPQNFGDQKRESDADTTQESEAEGVEPTTEEMKTLRRISGTINWQIMTVTFVEFCERFSYYGMLRSNDVT